MGDTFERWDQWTKAIMVNVVLVANSRNVRSFLVAQWVKGRVLSLQLLGSLLWCGFDPWPGNFCIPRAWPKTKQNKQTKKQNKTQKFENGKALWGHLVQHVFSIYRWQKCVLSVCQDIVDRVLGLGQKIQVVLFFKTSTPSTFGWKDGMSVKLLQQNKTRQSRSGKILTTIKARLWSWRVWSIRSALMLETCFFCLFIFLRPHPRHMDVPRPGV